MLNADGGWNVCGGKRQLLSPKGEQLASQPVGLTKEAG